MDELQKKLVQRLEKSKTALLVVDVQNDFCHAEGAFGKRVNDFSFVEKVMPPLLDFIKKCREAGLLTVYIRTFHSPMTDSPSWRGRMSDFVERVPICTPDTWGSDFYLLDRKQADYIVTKHRFSGFVGTDLDLVLRGKGIQTVVMTGFTSNVCVETTARDAFNRNYYVVFVDDCCGAPLPGEHEAAATNISRYFGLVANSKTVLDVLNRSA